MFLNRNCTNRYIVQITYFVERLVTNAYLREC